MEVDRIGIHVELAVDDKVHRVAERIGIVYRLLCIEVPGKRYRDAGSHERHSLAPFLRCDQVQGAKLIVFAPSAPIRNSLQQLIELRLR